MICHYLYDILYNIYEITFPVYFFFIFVLSLKSKMTTVPSGLLFLKDSDGRMDDLKKVDTLCPAT